MAATKIENSSSVPAALLTAAWATISLIAFFTNRGNDVGQIGKLIGNLGGGPLIGWDGLRDSIVGGMIAVGIFLAWFGLGSLITKFIRRERGENHSHVLEIAASIATGAAAWSLVWFFLGIAGLYYSVVAVAMTLIGFALAIYGAVRFREMQKESRTPDKASSVDWFLLFLVAVPVVLALVGALAPPTAKDTLLYHFALPKAFIAQHSNAFV